MSEQLNLIYLPELSMSFSSLKKHLSELYNIQIQKEMSDSKKVQKLYDKANYLFNNYIANNGTLNYSDKEYGYLGDELEDVAVGYFKDESVDGDYAETLRNEGFTMTEQDAINVLEHRIESIEEEVGPVQFAEGGGVGKIYEVGIDEGTEIGTRTLADFTTEKDAKDFMYDYQLKHPAATLFIDTMSAEYTDSRGMQVSLTNRKIYAEGGGVGVVKIGDKVTLPEIKMPDGRVQYEKIENGEVIYIENGIYGVMNPKTKRIHQVLLEQMEYANGGGVRKRTLYAIMYGKYAQMDNPQYVEVSSKNMDEAMEKFKAMGVDAMPSAIEFSNRPPYYYAEGGGVGDINMEFLKVFKRYGFINSYSYGHNAYENKNKDIIVFSPKSDTIGKGWLTLQLSNNIEERLHLKPFTTSALIDLFNKYGLLQNVNKGELSYKFAKGGGVRKRSLMSMANLVVADWIKESIRDWYTKNYPTDDLGKKINEITFEDLWNATNVDNIYGVIGVGDSLIRERLFEHLSEIYGVSYNDVYDRLFGSDKFAEGGGVAEMARGGYVSKGEMVWRKLTASERADFLYKNFTPEITPRSQEILVGKAWNFLSRNVKMAIQSQYANVEEYANGGGIKNIPYKNEEIMFEPTENKYYVKDEEFNSLKEAKNYIDSGSPMSEKTINAYRYGAFKNGGGVGHMNTVKSYWNMFDKKKRVDFLIGAGYLKSVAEDLSNEGWDSLEARVHKDLLSSIMADGGGIEKFASGAKFTNAVNHLKDFIRKYPYIWTKNGKEYVPIEGWQYAALLMGYSARVTSIEQMGAGYMAKAEVIDGDSNVVCSGFGYVDSNEAKWANKPVYQLIGFAQTRAVSRALRNCLSWMVKAAGFSTTPAEEMYGVMPEKRGGGMKSRAFMPPAAPQQEPDFIFDEPKYKAPMASSAPPTPVMPEDMGGLDAQKIEETLREMNAKAKANNIEIVSPEFMNRIKDALLETDTDLHMSMLKQAIDYMDQNNIVLQTPRYMLKLRKIASQKPF